MSKSIALLLVLIFLTASCIMVAKPALSSIGVAEDSWASKAPMHEARNNLGVAVVNNKIYAIGGDTLSGFWTFSMGFSGKPTGGVVGTNEEYDPATDTWTFKKPMPTPRTGFAIAAYKNKIYCIGGATSHDIYVGAKVTGINEVYDLTTDTWETKKPMPTATWLVPTNVVNGKIYVIDWDGKNYVYDIATDSWSTKAPTPSPSAAGFDGHVSAVVDGKIYVIGGLSKNQDSNLHQIYNPETDMWSYGTPPPNSIGNANGNGAAGATTGVMAPKRIYVLGQQGNLRQGEPPGSNRIYDPKNDSWTFGANLPTDRINFGVAVVNDTLYAIGGGRADNWFVGSFGPSAVNEQYTPVRYGTPDPSYVPPIESTPPEIAVLLPENKNYTSSNISLVFTVNKPTVWMGYSLDGQENVTVTSNTTLAELTSGLHNVTVYAKDAFENMGTSETIIFSIAKEPEPFPTTLVTVASGASVAIIGVGLLVYFKKRNH